MRSVSMISRSTVTIFFCTVRDIRRVYSVGQSCSSIKFLGFDDLTPVVMKRCILRGCNDVKFVLFC